MAFVSSGYNPEKPMEGRISDIGPRKYDSFFPEVIKKNFGKWLDFAVQGNDLKLLVAPFPTEALETWPVSKAVSRTGNDGPELLART